MYCKHCGNQIDETSRFCTACGTSVEANEISVVTTIDESAATTSESANQTNSALPLTSFKNKITDLFEKFKRSQFVSFIKNIPQKIKNAFTGKHRIWYIAGTSICALLLIIGSILLFGKSKEVIAVEKAIKGIDNVTLSSGDLIQSVEDMFNELEVSDQKRVGNIEHLQDSRIQYDILVYSAEAAEVDKAISALGELTLESENEVKRIRNLYDNSSSEAKKYIKNLPELEKAELIIDELHVNNVISSIDAIGTVSLKSSNAISTAREAYNSLKSDLKAKITNLDILENAETQYQEKLKKYRQEQKTKLLKKFNVTTDKVQGIKWYEPKAMPKYIDIRSYLLPYIGGKNSNYWVCIRYNYTSDDWVFWKKLTIVVDGKHYTKSYSYYSVVRDNQYGNVWEYYDECLNYNEPMTSETLEMLRAIAASKETIVRFEGSDYHYDYTVKSSDKTAIANTLDLYEILISE